MDNYNQQPMQASPYGGQPNTQPMQAMPQTYGQSVFGQPMMPQASSTMQLTPKTPEKKKISVSDIIKIVIIVILSITTILFVYLFIKANADRDEAQSNLDEKINIAVAEAKDAQAAELEAAFAEREKNPYKEFVGPEDYGSLAFEYPKTWSVYVARDASNGGDFEAYFNPGEVEAVSDSTINALRLIISTSSFENVVANYEWAMNQRDSDLSIRTIVVNDATANLYEGTIPGTELSGYIVIFKIRDKTAILQSDSILFENDFITLLDTVTYNS